MSISTPGGAPERVPSTVSTDKQSGAGKPPAGGAKPGGGARPAANRPGSRPTGGGKGPKGRKPIAAVKANGGRNWGPIAAVAVVVLIAVGIIGYGAFASMNGPQTWEDRANAIKGIVNYRDNPDKSITARDHKSGPIAYKVIPPVGGEHNGKWQNCMGDVYDAPIANEHAVHSLEHGAVWVTYKLGISSEEVSKLAENVNGKPFTLMSPVDGLPSNISLQAWGYQLKVESAGDPRIDDFIRSLSLNASVEPGIPCSGGVTQTGTVPVDGAPTGQ